MSKQFSACWGVSAYAWWIHLEGIRVIYWTTLLQNHDIQRSPCHIYHIMVSLVCCNILCIPWLVFISVSVCIVSLGLHFLSAFCLFDMFLSNCIYYSYIFTYFVCFYVNDEWNHKWVVCANAWILKNVTHVSCLLLMFV